MRNNRLDPATTVGRWLHATRYEIIPTQSIAGKVLASVPKNVAITVTASPLKGLEPTLALAEELSSQGYQVVPHVAARLVRDETHLAQITRRMLAAGIDDVFVPAGDASTPAGRFGDSYSVLAELSRGERRFSHVGITGYPESHPSIHDDVTVQSMWDKRSHATYIVSNLCFDPKTVAAWTERVRRRGVELAVRIGIAGPVERAKLLAMATRIGVGESTRFLGKHASWFVRLSTPGGYSPERFLRKTAASLPAGTNVVGLHVFTFNQVAETERWRQELISRLGAEPGTALG